MSDANSVYLEHGTCANFGIAAVGFSFGRQDRTLPQRFALDKKLRPSNHSHAPTGSAPASFSRTMPPLALDETTTAKTPHQEVRDGPDARKAIPHRRASLKGSLHGSMKARLRRQTNGDSSPRTMEGPLSMEPNRPSTGGRPSSSWLQRISTISSPLSGSSQSSSCPDSPSMSGSTAQMLPPQGPKTSAVAPNKLVKRSTSQRAISAGNPTRSLGRSPTTPGLRRPATSHQRGPNPPYHNESRHHAFPDSQNCVSNIETLQNTNPCLDNIWHPYFTSNRRTTAHKYHRRRANSVSTKGESVRQLTVEPGNLPTLLLATSITPETRKFPPNTGNNLFPSTRQTYDVPNSPRAPGPTSTENQNQELSLTRNRASTINSTAWNIGATEARRKNRGFTLTHGRVPSQVEDPRTSKTERITPHSSGLRRRRNITDPSVFQRPMTSSQDEFYSAQANSIDKKTSPTGFPPPPLLRPFEFDVDTSEESGSCQPGPLPNPRSSLPRQRDASQGSNFSPPASYPRTKRFSIAASDPASTLIGSDNDTKVFTSGDEDETDFQSDTACDSFPNRAMRSSDSVSRPRIESIFDQPTLQLTQGKLAALERSIPAGSVTKGTYPDASNMSEYASLHEFMPGSQKIARRPSNVCDIQANGYRLPYKTSTKEIPQQASNPKAHISEPGRDLVPGKYSDRGSKQFLFDWSEQHKSENDLQGSTFRPRTVHGKNEAKARATRTLTRRGPSVLHLRSQSVPVSRDPSSTGEPHYASMKFGTWGLGNKGVSEDWDGDFEFEESEKQFSLDHDGDTTEFTLACQGMKVPQAIMERQASVHGQFGHVKELTLLVEELRRLRLQAKTLSITGGPSNELWKEAEGIINLATVDDNNSTSNPPRSPSSPTTSLDWCDDESPRSKKSREKGSHDSDPNSSPLSIKTNDSPSTTLGRTKSSSSTKVQSVLDTIYQQRKVHGSIHPEAKAHSQQRLPFDTQSLRDLVVRAGVVTRALKDIVRRAQGVSSDSDSDLMCQDPPFSQIFSHPSSNSSTLPNPSLPSGKDGNRYHGGVSPSVGNENEISPHMKMMTVV